jgi:2,5-dihydroxypyridine 5,6-dioxygenase
LSLKSEGLLAVNATPRVEISMPEYYEYELGKTAQKIASELFKLKSGETFVITADTESDSRAVNAMATAAFAVGAKPMVIWIPSPQGVGKAADPMLPVEALTATLKVADAWVEFNNKYLLYSTPFEIAERENKKLRYMNLSGMNVDMLVRTIGRVDMEALGKFQGKLAELLRTAKKIKLTSPAGENVEMKFDPKGLVVNDVGFADTPGPHFLSGQLTPGYSSSVNGLIVFDGSVVPPIGLVKEPVRLYVREGRVERIEGGKDALALDTWLRNFHDPDMFRVAHLSFGSNPGANLTGNIVEDERVWGSTEWGLGYVGPDLTTDGNPIPAASHTDGTCLNTSVWLDEAQIFDKGKVVHGELAELAKKLGRE